MKEGNHLPGYIRGSMIGLLVVASSAGWAQQPGATAPSDSLADLVHDLQAQVTRLQTSVDQMRTEAAESRAESAELRRELEATRSQLAEYAASPTRSASSSAEVASEQAATRSARDSSSLGGRVNSLEEATQLLGDKINEQYQTKIESASKYRVRLSGIVLLNLFANRGATDNQDVPSYVNAPNAYLSSGSFGATMRQSELGLEVFGPRLAGARTSGNFQADFSGGFPNATNGVNYGLFRLRVASMKMDWEHTSIVAGQDNLFLSPQAPSSFASLAVPAFSYAGNLWGWIPQVRVEHRIELPSEQSITVQAGILDNLTGEPPYTQYGRVPQAGERSNQPAYGARVAWRASVLGQPLTLGAAGYYSPQNWGFYRRVDGWAGMTDWEVPLTQWVSLTGEFYRGRAVGGLGGGMGRSVIFSGSPTDPATQIRALDSMGGWAQLKIRASSKLEFNGGFGLDNSFAADLRAFPANQSYIDPTLARNLSSLINLVYRPRSNLLLSTEYRHLRTFRIDNEDYPADQVNLVMGILF